MAVHSLAILRLEEAGSFLDGRLGEMLATAQLLQDTGTVILPFQVFQRPVDRLRIFDFDDQHNKTAILADAKIMADPHISNSMKKEIKGNAILKKPEYPGGIKALKAFIAKHLSYPPEALENQIEGTVHLRYGIDHTGKVSDVKIIKGIGGGCDEEAVRLVRMLAFNLEHTRGVRVLFHKKIQIHFRLPVERPVQQPVQEIGYTITPAKKTTPETSRPQKSYTITITYS